MVNMLDGSAYQIRYITIIFSEGVGNSLCYSSFMVQELRYIFSL